MFEALFVMRFWLFSPGTRKSRFLVEPNLFGLTMERPLIFFLYQSAWASRLAEDGLQIASLIDIWFTGETMSLKKFRNLFFVVAFMAVMAGAGTVMVSAEEADTRVPGPKTTDTRGTDSKPDPCLGDRADADETMERSSGGCPGPVPTPEPVSILLFSAGLAGVGFAARRRLRRAE